MAYRYRSAEMYGIQEIANGRGWRVAISRLGKEYQRVFSTVRFGTAEAALEAAKAWRDQTARRLPALTKAEVSQHIRPDNTSGCPGVYLIRQTRKGRDGRVLEYVYWCARSPEGLRPVKHRQFSVNRYGYGHAYELAVKARQAFVSLLEGYQLPVVPAELHPSAEALSAI